MRFNGLDMNLLVALDAMLMEQNISKAAAKMHMTQSAMSNALGRLRDYFEDELLIQVGRRLEMTPRAQQLQAAVRALLLQMESTIVTKPTFDPATSDRAFKLLVSEYTTNVLMPVLLRKAYELSHSVTFDLLQQRDDPEGLLTRGDADVLIIPEGFASTQHPFETLYEDSYTCVVWEGNTKIGGSLSHEEYLAAGHVAVQYGPSKTPAFDGWFLQKYGVVRRVEVTTSSLAAPAFLIQGTDRIATMHTRLALQFRQLLPIRLLEPPFPIPRLKQVIQWHKHKGQDLGLAWLKSLAHQAARLI